jgi:hypothetical protein
LTVQSVSLGEKIEILMKLASICADRAGLLVYCSQEMAEALPGFSGAAEKEVKQRGQQRANLKPGRIL